MSGSRQFSGSDPGVGTADAAVGVATAAPIVTTTPARRVMNARTGDMRSFKVVNFMNVKEGLLMLPDQPVSSVLVREVVKPTASMLDQAMTAPARSPNGVRLRVITMRLPRGSAERGSNSIWVSLSTAPA